MGLSAQNVLCDPYIIKVNLDSVRSVKVSDAQYLDDLNYMQKNVKQNQTNLKNCVSDLKNTLKSVSSQDKMLGSERKFLKKELSLLDKQESRSE